MSEDLILKDPKGNRYSYNNIQTQAWLDGRPAGLELAIGWLRKQAMELFESRKYEDATHLSKMADKMKQELEGDLQEQISKHRLEYPGLLDREVR